jgi:hypothetical protein
VLALAGLRRKREKAVCSLGRLIVFHRVSRALFMQLLNSLSRRRAIGQFGPFLKSIVFVVNEDPVRLGLVASLAQPGGSATGINILIGELVAKRLELWRELVPGAARVAVLVNPANATSTETTLRDVEPAGRAIGLQIQVLNASTARACAVLLLTVT